MARTKKTSRPSRSRSSSYHSNSPEVEYNSFRRSPSASPRRCSFARTVSGSNPRWLPHRSGPNQDVSWRAKRNSIPQAEHPGWALQNPDPNNPWSIYDIRRRSPTTQNIWSTRPASKINWKTYGPQCQIDKLNKELKTVKDELKSQKALLELATLSVSNLKHQILELRYEHSDKLQSLLTLFEGHQESLQDLTKELKRKASQAPILDPGASPHSPVYGPASDSEEDEDQRTLQSSLARRVEQASKRRKGNCTASTHHSSSDSDTSGVYVE